MVGKPKIIWDDDAKKFLKSALHYIRSDSPQNAEKVKREIKAIVRALSVNPERHPQDKYRINKNDSYRAFELYKLRFSYVISDTEIRIVRIRHTSQEPLFY